MRNPYKKFQNFSIHCSKIRDGTISLTYERTDKPKAKCTSNIFKVEKVGGHKQIFCLFLVFENKIHLLIREFMP